MRPRLDGAWTAQSLFYLSLELLSSPLLYCECCARPPSGQGQTLSLLPHAMWIYVLRHIIKPNLAYDRSGRGSRRGNQARLTRCQTRGRKPGNAKSQSTQSVDRCPNQDTPMLAKYAKAKPPVLRSKSWYVQATSYYRVKRIWYRIVPWGKGYHRCW